MPSTSPNACVSTVALNDAVSSFSEISPVRTSIAVAVACASAYCAESSSGENSSCADGDSCACIASKSWRSHASAKRWADAVSSLDAPTAMPTANAPTDMTTSGAARLINRWRRASRLGPEDDPFCEPWGVR